MAKTVVRLLPGVHHVAEKHATIDLHEVDKRLNKARDNPHAKESGTYRHNGICQEWHTFVKEQIARGEKTANVRVVGTTGKTEAGTFFQIALKDGERTRSMTVHESCIGSLQPVRRGQELFELTAA